MRTAVMEGSLTEFDLSSVIQVVSIGRQFTGVELFDEAGNVVGTLFLKSGKILEARSGSLSGLDAVSTLLRGSRDRRFTVYRTEPVSDARAPVGSVGEVLLKLMHSEACAPQRLKVMEGSLSEFDLMTVLQVISIGRQFTGVDVFDPAERLLGTIELKAGKVVSARSDHLEGIDAIRRLLRSPRDSRFVVHRSREEVGDRYLGSLAQILVRLSDVDAGWDAAEPNTRARRSSPAAPAASPPGPSAAAQPAPRPPEAHARAGRAEPAAAFIETHTSPFGLATLALPAGDVPVVCVTSPKGGAGKTTVALNLGVAFARQGRRVTLVDADYDGVLLSLNASGKSTLGAFEVVAGRGRLPDAAVQTRLSGLRIVRSGDPALAASSSRSGWAQLLREAKSDADIVLVDTSAGFHGPSGDACAVATHALVVLPAEPLAVRALAGHLKRIEALRDPPPRVVGIVLNMLDYRARASVGALHDLCGGPSGPWVFDIPIARSTAFMDAVARGVPVCRGDRDTTPTIGWVFEMLASGILERLGLASTVADEGPLLG